ncbi:MAG: ABC transporter ATP-binding protein [Anaerolineae bacterium]|nr:ABC transporter ATP-binding protein/permease [Anaerolineae bacterium]MDW8098014.1 ABC transporter ATP-binding protein [Anaerolineae bacterium]
MNHRTGRPSLGRDLGRALSYLRRYWLTTLGAWLSLLLMTAGNLAAPRLLQVLIDQGIKAGDLRLIYTLAAGLVGLAAARGLFTFLQGYLSEKASQGVAFDLRQELYAKLQSLSFSYHDQAQTGQLMTRATNDVEILRMFTGMGFLQLLSTALMFLGTAFLLISLDWQLALLSLTIVPIALVVITTLTRRIMPRFLIIQQKLGYLNTLLQENLAGARVVKAFAREPYEIERFQAANVSLLEENLRVARVFSFSIPLIFGLGNLGSLIVIWVGGLQVINSRLTLGELVAFNTYVTMLTLPLFFLGMIMGLMTQAGASARRIFEILDADVEVREKPNTISLPPMRGRVEFDHVTFRYVGANEDTLQDVSFVVEPGETVALLGATGSGKTTITHLIPRFYDVTSGAVRVDGYDVRDVTLHSLRSQIGIVLQETNLFTGTIRENIAYGRPDATMEEVIEAAKAAEAHDFIMSFPDGYETRIGERGVGLSGGQKQRIAIARALLLNPRILILDDSTSNVDLETEARIRRALERLMKGRTSFVIAQRISTVQKADRILVLDRGRLVAQGRHEELLESSPIYAEIYHLQLNGRRPVGIEAVAVSGDSRRDGALGQAQPANSLKFTHT